MAESRVKLVIDSQEFDAKLKRAGDALNRFFDVAKKNDRTFEVVDEGVMEAVKAMGKMETASKSAKGSLAELQKAFTDMSLTYRRFTDEEKASPVGKAMAQSLSELKTRINDTKKDLAAINQELSGSKFGQFGGVIDTIGHKMGLTSNVTELLTSKTALMYAGIGAGIAIVGKATDAWVKYNQELAKQDQQTNIITGLDGFAANHMTDTMRALSDTYKVDFRAAVEAANTLMSQFGKSGDEAISLIKDGMQGMMMGEGGKMLQMIQQYAPAFRDAGVSASQLIAVIHNTQGGLFSPENMNAIVMGMRNIRLMTKQTSEALAKLGIDGQQMSKQLNDGTITVFDALKQVAGELKNVDSNSQAAGQVMQSVFGRQGAMAGTNLAKAIEELNTNLDETKTKTGELGDAFAELQTANEHLNTAIREAFSYDGWEQMTISIKATLIETLGDVIEKLGQVKGLLAGISPSQARQSKYGSGNIPDEVAKDLSALQNATAENREQMYQQLLAKYEQRYQKESAALYSAQRSYDANEQSSNWQGIPFARKALDRHYWSTQVNTARSNVAAEQDIMSLFRAEAQKILNPEPTKPIVPIATITPTSTSEKEVTIQQQIAALEKEAVTASDERLQEIILTVAALDKQLALEKEIKDVVHGRTPTLNQPVGDRKAFEQQQMVQFEAEFEPYKFDGLGQKMIASINAEIATATQNADVATLRNLLSVTIQNGLDGIDIPADSLMKQIMGEGVNIDDTYWKSLEDSINEKLKELNLEPIKLDFKTGAVKEQAKTMAEDWRSAASAIQSVGTAMSQIEDPMAKVMGTIAQAIATIALTFAQSLKGTFTPWDWIAAATAGTATMISTIAAIKSATAGTYANGGIVPGNSYSGDNLVANVNSGELILNRAQQNNLAGQLQGGGGYGNMRLEAVISGEDLRLVLNNNGRRTGRGEYITSNFTRG